MDNPFLGSGHDGPPHHLACRIRSQILGAASLGRCQRQLPASCPPRSPKPQRQDLAIKARKSKRQQMRPLPN
jgi:hypothetical protein